MLVFSRRTNEVSVIDLGPLFETLGITREQLADVGFEGDDPIVTVEIRSGGVGLGQCRLGFQAPPIVKLHRKEVYDAIHAEREAS